MNETRGPPFNQWGEGRYGFFIYYLSDTMLHYTCTSPPLTAQVALARDAHVVNVDARGGHRIDLLHIAKVDSCRA